MTQKELAREIVVERGRALRDGRRIPYYLVNINHPAISALYNAYSNIKAKIREYARTPQTATGSISFLSANAVSA